MAQNFIIGIMFTLGQKMLGAIKKKQPAFLVWEKNPVQLNLYTYYRELCPPDILDMYTILCLKIAFAKAL